MKDLIIKLLRIACYLALAFVVAGFGSLLLVSLLDVCPSLNEGAVRCVDPFWQDIAEFGMTAVLLTVFTGFPGLLAMGGVIFLIRDFAKWRRGTDRGTIESAPRAEAGSETISMGSTEEIIIDGVPVGGETITSDRVGSRSRKPLIWIVIAVVAGGFLFGVYEGVKDRMNGNYTGNNEAPPNSAGEPLDSAPMENVPANRQPEQRQSGKSKTKT